MNADEFLMSGGITSAKFPVIGTTVTGTITAEPEVRQQTDFDTGKPLTWEDGTPRMQLVVTIQTAERDPANPDDDGLRALYVKSQLKTAVRDAVRKAGAPGLKVGGTLTVTYVADGQITRKGQPPKQYTAAYVPPSPANDFLNGGEPQQAAPAQPSPLMQAAAPGMAAVQASNPIPAAYTAAQQAAPAPAPAPQPVPQAAPAAPATVPAGVGADALAALQALTPEQRAALGL